jgi:hypothetical protein
MRAMPKDVAAVCADDPARARTYHQTKRRERA